MALGAAILSLAACGLPRSGPTRGEIFAGSVMREGDAFVLVVDDRINAVAGVVPSLGFHSGLVSSGQGFADIIQAGDTLSITVFENVDDGLIVPQGQNATVLSEVQVDGQGFVFVPYAGRIRAGGNTIEGVRQAITRQLEEQTPDPQVQVARLAGDASSVIVAGEVAAPGVFLIDQGTQTIAAAIASAGGTTVDPDVAEVTLVRGGWRGSVFFEDLFMPGGDVLLRPGDRILVESDDRSFTALGSTGSQAQVVFEDRTVSAIEAIAQVGGLSPTSADPTGVFVFRNEPEEIARQLTGRPDLQGTQRVIYVFDLTRPNGIFFARDFAVRDDDTLYVTQAPFVQFSNVIRAFTGTLGAARTATDTVQ